MRAFFSIPIPDKLRRPISDVAQCLRSSTSMRATWVARENYHITLRFLGDIDPPIAVELEALCKSLGTRIAPFKCTFDRIDAFPSPDRARVVWVGGQAPPALRELSQALAAGLLDLGFPKIRMESLVHVTLARVKDHPDPALPARIASLNPIQPLAVAVHEIRLMESVLTPQGAVYSTVFAAELCGRGQALDAD
jgi:2'-5' RNA ligase